MGPIEEATHSFRRFRSRLDTELGHERIGFLGEVAARVTAETGVAMDRLRAELCCVSVRSHWQMNAAPSVKICSLAMVEDDEGLALLVEEAFRASAAA
jgi:hypothetical protein